MLGVCGASAALQAPCKEADGSQQRTRTLPLLACALVLLEGPGALLMSPSALRTTHVVGYDC